jgi:hypothetical protein
MRARERLKPSRSARPNNAASATTAREPCASAEPLELAKRYLSRGASTGQTLSSMHRVRGGHRVDAVGLEHRLGVGRVGHALEQKGHQRGATPPAPPRGTGRRSPSPYLRP